MGRAVAGIALGVAIVVAGFVAAEIVLRATGSQDRTIEWTYPDTYFRRDAVGLLLPPAGRFPVVARRTDTGATLYEVTYTIDEFGKRKTPVAAAQSRTKFAAFFGCSFTFGEGLDDDETLPYYFGTEAPEYVPYNFAFQGGGPFDAMARLDTYDAAAEIAEREGIAVYVYIDDHVNRLTDTTRTASWRRNAVYYEPGPDGRFEHRGTFRSARPLRSTLFALIGGSHVLRALGVHWPTGIHDDAIELTAAALADFGRRFRDRVPGAELVVVAYPGQWASGKLGVHLETLGVRYYDFKDLFSSEDPEYRISDVDRHPNAKGQQTLARALARELGVGGGD